VTTLEAEGQKTRFVAVGDWLARDDLLLVSSGPRQSMRKDWLEIDEKERNLDDRLFIGIVGGTGVGKSTFINALARSEISSSGDRRPTTDRVVAYRHRDNELEKDFPATDLAEPQVCHEESSLSRVVLLDFPDFDSVEAAHREILERHLPTIDVLFVIVDDVKYADRLLFELLRGLPHDARNVHYVLNKVDLFSARYGDRSDEIVAEILADFRAKLAEHAGLDASSDQLRAISALQALEDTETGDTRPFDEVRELLETYREEKRRREAKRLNLEELKSVWVDSVREAVLSDRIRAYVDRAHECVSTRRRELEEALERLSSDVLTRPQRAALRSRCLGEGASTWPFPLSTFFSLFARMRRQRSTSEADSAPTDLAGFAACIRRHYRGTLDVFANLEATVAAELDGAPFSFRATGSSGDSEAKDGSPDDWTDDLTSKLERELTDASGAAPVSRPGRLHIPALLVALTIVVSRLVSMPKSASEAPGFFTRLGDGIRALVEPEFLVALVLCVVGAYGLTSAALWSRRSRQFEFAATRAQKDVLQEMDRRIRGGLDSLSGFVARLDHEWDAVRTLVDGDLSELPGPAGV
jgi:GTP-binding protein EngB required for normal cell division